MKTAIEVLDAFENIRRAQHAGAYAPHKPLLVLLALGRMQRGDQYAADAFSRETGEAPPVEGRRPVPKDLDQAARMGVSDRLGHSRIEITRVYLGPSDSGRGTAPRSPA